MFQNEDILSLFTCEEGAEMVCTGLFWSVLLPKFASKGLLPFKMLIKAAFVVKNTCFQVLHVNVISTSFVREFRFKNFLT